ncbi:MAG: hypothetical protein ILO53_06020, partial [Clostridia bacterium]|nr:hypothetical protein [Clostridia bacterium]
SARRTFRYYTIFRLVFATGFRRNIPRLFHEYSPIIHRTFHEYSPPPAGFSPWFREHFAWGFASFSHGVSRAFRMGFCELFA